MKKILVFILMIFALTISLFATDNSVYTYDNGNITIQFDSTIFNETERERIVNYMYTGIQLTNNSVWCTLFGHDMGSSECVIITSHLAYNTAPRCKSETYSVSTCSRCNYISSALIGSMPLSCCS